MKIIIYIKEDNKRIEEEYGYFKWTCKCGIRGF